MTIKLSTRARNVLIVVGLVLVMFFGRSLMLAHGATTQDHCSGSIPNQIVCLVDHIICWAWPPLC